MIISRTPVRMSFVGGGTDLQSAYSICGGGAVVTTAIDKYIYVTVNTKFDHRIRVSYSRTENVDHYNALEHDRVRNVMQMLGPWNDGIEITSISDIPSEGSGLGSSSTFTVGLINALSAYSGRAYNAERLANLACEIEINKCQAPIGKQDQYAAAYGGFQFMQFHEDGRVSVDPIICQDHVRCAFEKGIILFYTGITRSADSILHEQDRDNANKRAVLGGMRDSAFDFRDALHRGDLDALGMILDSNWRMKKTLAGGISNPIIDGWYDAAKNAGALGGKLLGAGGGGFLMFLADPADHPKIAAKLPGLRQIPFNFEPQGSKIIFIER